MTITEITIPLDTDTARVYQDASTEDQKKILDKFSVYGCENMAHRQRPLTQS